MRTTLGLSARNRRILALGIRGGADDTPTPVADLLAQAGAVQDLADDDLGALDELLTDAMREALSGVVTDADLALADEIQTARLAVLTAADERMTAQADRDARAQELLASITPNEPEPEPETPETPEPDPAPEAEVEVETPAPVVEIAPEPEVIPEAVPLAAAASVVTRVEARRPVPRPVRAAAPAPEFVLRASAGGALLDNSDKIGEAFSRTIRDIDTMQPGRLVRVATLGAIDDVETERMFGSERFLDYDAYANARKIEAVTSRPALRASGGVCAPSPIQYDQSVMGTDMRPVRDGMLVRFGADRGGVQLIPPPQLNDAAIASGVTTWTNANDIALNSPSTKAVTTIACGSPATTTVDAIVSRVKIGNFQSKYFRERVESFIAKVSQYAARVAETKLLTAIGAGSTQVVDITVLGSARDILTHIDQHAAQIRSRYRLAPDFPLRLGLPDWVLDNMRSDLTREQPGSTAERLATTEAELISFFAVRNINVTWYLDGETGMIFGAQSDGAAIGWPTHAIGYLYPEGEWLFLDGGAIDLGVTRDSTMNGTNDYEIFSEFMENTARTFNGPSYRLDIDLCPSGATALPISTAAVCVSGS